MSYIIDADKAFFGGKYEAILIEPENINPQSHIHNLVNPTSVSANGFFSWVNVVDGVDGNEEDFKVDYNLIKEIYLGNDTWDFSKFSYKRKEKLSGMLNCGLLHIMMVVNKQKEESYEREMENDKYKLNFIMNTMKHNILEKIRAKSSENRKQRRSNDSAKKNKPYYQQFKKGKFYG